MNSVFGVDQREFMSDLRSAAAAENGAEQIRDMLDTNAGSLGIDYRTRNYFVLDGYTGSYITGSADQAALPREQTVNLLTARNAVSNGDETTAGANSDITADYMDVAVPILGGDHAFIIYILDNKDTVSGLNSQLFTIIMQALVIGLLISVLLSFLLSKTMVGPIEKLTAGAEKVAAGDFDSQLPVESTDEIGILTGTFNEMAGVLQSTLAAVENERNKLDTLFLHMTDGVAAFTTDGTLIHMNPATENLLGVRVEQKLSFDEMFADLDMPDTDETVSRSFLTNEITRFGRVLSVTLAPYGALDGEGGVIAVIHDVTEQRRLDDARREFVANVSHELRTPLTNIRSYTETLLDAAGELPLDTEKQFLGVISSESERMARIVTDLLTLSKLDYGRMELRMTRFSVSDLLKKVTNAMKLTAEDSGHMILVETEPNLPPRHSA